MRRVIALVSREMQGKGLILLGALLLGFLPFLMPHLATAGTYTDAEARDVTANVLAVFVGAGLAIFLGYFALGQDLAEGRLGFYFSRPLTSSEIWGGKFLGNLLAVLLATIFVVLPVTVAGGGFRNIFKWNIPPAIQWLPLPEASGTELLAGVAVALTLVFCLAHVIGIVIRARSIWLLADFVIACAALVSFGFSSRRLIFAWALEADKRGMAALTVAMAATLLIACYLSVGMGRTELRPASRAISVAFLAVLFPCLLGFEIYSRWVVDVAPRDLVQHELMGGTMTAAPQREWIIVSGNARYRGDYEPYFLWNPTSGAFLHIGDRGYNWPSSTAFSQDGARAVWLRLKAAKDNWGYELFSADLSRESLRPVSSRLVLFGEPPTIVLSPDGRALAGAGEKSLSVYEIRSGARLSSFAIPPRGDRSVATPARLHFLSPSRILLLRPEYSTVSKTNLALDLYTFDLVAGALSGSVRIDFPEGFLFFTTDSNCEHVILRSRASQDLCVYTTRSGSLVSRISSTNKVETRTSAFLSDGRLVVGEVGSDRARLHIFSGDLSDRLNVDLGPGRRIYFGGQPDPDNFFIEVSSMKEGGPTKGRLLLVTLDNGEVREVARDLYPIAWRMRWMAPDPAQVPQPGSIAARLFYNDHDGVVEFESATGKFKTLIAGVSKSD